MVAWGPGNLLARRAGQVVRCRGREQVGVGFRYGEVHVGELRTHAQDGCRDLADGSLPFFPDHLRSELDPARLQAAIPLLRDRAHSLVELADQARTFVDDDVRFDSKAAAKFLGEEEQGRLRALSDSLESVDPWETATIEPAFRSLADTLEIKFGKLAQPTRVALTGGTVSPGIFELCEALGKKRTLERLRNACAQAAAGTLPLAESDG